MKKSEMMGYLAVRPDAPMNVRIWYAFLRSGLRIEDVAEPLYTTHTTIFNWMSGKIVPRPDDIHRLANVLSVSPRWLIKGGSTDDRLHCMLDDRSNDGSHLDGYTSC